MMFGSGQRIKKRNRGDVVAVLDLGTTKIACIIARLHEDREPEIIGIGHNISQGIKAGVVVDMEAAEKAIGTAVSAAEDMAGQTVRHVLVSLSGKHILSRNMGVEVAIGGHAVNDQDLKQALSAHHRTHHYHDQELIHAIPVAFSIDDNPGIRDPRGMVGEKMGVNMHLVTATKSTVRNLVACIERCHLEVENFVAAPYTAGLACLVEDEITLGATLIDIGGGTTDIGVFFDGRLVFADSLPVGGAHVTNDLARGLMTPLAAAERLKTLHGCARSNPVDEREIIEIPQVGDGHAEQMSQIPRSMLTAIIQPRMEEIFEMVRNCLEIAGFDKIAGRRVVLTGGGSQLHHLGELAQLVLDKQVRLGRPICLEALPASVNDPAFSTAIGLLLCASGTNQDLMQNLVEYARVSQDRFFGKFGGWLRDNF